MEKSRRKQIIEDHGSFYVLVPSRMVRVLGIKKKAHYHFYINSDSELCLSFGNGDGQREPSISLKEALDRFIYLTPYR